MAANSQTLVIGFGLGNYNFEDENLKEIENLLYGSEFIEWYLFDNVGFGLRTHKFYKTGSSDDEEFMMVNANFTVNWVFMGSDSDFRAGLYVGYGPGSVTYKNTDTGIDIAEAADTNSHGVFCDWGGETFGLRLGYHQVISSFEYEDGDVSGTVNGTGNSLDLGARLSF